MFLTQRKYKFFEILKIRYANNVLLKINCNFTSQFCFNKHLQLFKNIFIVWKMLLLKKQTQFFFYNISDSDVFHLLINVHLRDEISY